MHTIDLTTGTELLLHLAKEHYYADTILDIIPGIALVMNENEQLNETIHHILEYRRVTQGELIEWSELDRHDKNRLSHFFDYLYFSSPAFFKEIS